MRKLIAVTAMTVFVACQPALASMGIPTDISRTPEKFCFVAGVMSASIMERVNVGMPLEVIYRETDNLSNKQMGAYLNETATMAAQFANHSSGPVPVKEFAQWNYQRCLEGLNPKS